MLRGHIVCLSITQKLVNKLNTEASIETHLHSMQVPMPILVTFLIIFE